MNLTPEKQAQLGKRFSVLDVHYYSETFEEDLLLLKWWMLLNETNELKLIVVPEARRLTPFLQIFASPTKTLYALDTFGRIEFVVWFTDASATERSAFMGIWSHSQIRGKRRHLALTKLIYETAFEFYNVLLGKTWQLDLLQIHAKLGYNIVGAIPNFFEEEVVYLVHLTRENYYRSKFAAIGG